MARLVDGSHYDAIVIGGGAAGLVSSGFINALGLKVALVSDGHPGGECLWTGCVPSKSLIHSAEVAHILKQNGAEISENAFLQALENMRFAREKIAYHDSVETIERSGVSVLTGRAAFLDSHRIKVGSATISAGKFVIATGGYQAIPKIKGFDTINCLTHESILELEEKPKSLAIVGAGPVGVEYAQAMTRLGIKVYLFEYAARVLPREEPEVSALVQKILEDEGVEVHTSCSVTSANAESDTTIILHFRKDDKEGSINTHAVLAATGKTPSTRDLNLDKAGVSLTEKGFVKVDEHQRTSATHIFACGDVCGLFQFTHYADHCAQVAALGVCFPLFGQFFKSEKLVVPWCTFLDPEVASVGLRKEEAFSKMGSDSVFELKYSLEDFDRAIVDDNARGFMSVLVDKKGYILGATIIGERAGEVIHEFSLAMKNGIPITGLSKTIHVYPTMSAAVRNLSAQFYKTVAKDSFGLKAARVLAKLMK